MKIAKSTGSKKFNTDTGKLPYNFRKIIVERLAGKGVSVKPQAITDVLRGHITNETLTKKIYKEILKVKNEQAKKSERLKSLRKTLR